MKWNHFFFWKTWVRNQNDSISQTILAFVVHLNSNAEKELIVFVGQDSLKSKVFSIATLVEEIKPFFLKEIEFEYWNLSIITAFNNC